MPSPLIVFTGTGTGIGKTFLAVATVKSWARQGAEVVGYKPIESGVVNIEETDGHLLDLASTFHVKPSLPMVRLKAPKSPHVAAREEGVNIPLGSIADAIADARYRHPATLVVEMPGGLFSPITEDELAVAFVERLRPTAVVLVAPDRLGVMHEVLATTEAALSRGVEITHVVLSPVRDTDASSGSNARELRRFLGTTMIVDAAPWGDPSPHSADTLVESLSLRFPHTPH
jgi:dethiobiotin synthetase